MCYIVAIKLHGPSEGFYVVTRVIYELLARDLPGTTWRRVYALAKLAFQEAIRRRVLVIMAVFIVGLLFGGLVSRSWYRQCRSALHQLRDDWHQLPCASAGTIPQLL